VKIGFGRGIDVLFLDSHIHQKSAQIFFVVVVILNFLHNIDERINTICINYVFSKIIEIFLNPSVIMKFLLSSDTYLIVFTIELLLLCFPKYMYNIQN